MNKEQSASADEMKGICAISNRAATTTAENVLNAIRLTAFDRRRFLVRDAPLSATKAQFAFGLLTFVHFELARKRKQKQNTSSIDGVCKLQNSRQS